MSTFALCKQFEGLSEMWFGMYWRIVSIFIKASKVFSSLCCILLHRCTGPEKKYGTNGCTECYMTYDQESDRIIVQWHFVICIYVIFSSFNILAWFLVSRPYLFSLSSKFARFDMWQGLYLSKRHRKLRVLQWVSHNISIASIFPHVSIL